MKTKLIIIVVTALALLTPVLFVLYKKRKAKKDLKLRVLADGNSDYSGTARNIALSISKSRQLYKNLIVKVHPDKFQDERKEKATELSSRITKAKRNYDELVGLEIEVKDFIGE